MPTLAMPKREDHKEVAYLREEISRKLAQYKKDHPSINSKSRIIEMALELFFEMQEREPLSPGELSRFTRGHPAQKHKGSDHA